MKRPLVIGYGNPLRQDDGIGWRAADLLESYLPAGSIDIRRKHQLTPELSDLISDASLVIFLDASIAQPPGCMACEPVEAETRSAFWHSLTPGQLLSLVDDPPPAYLISGGVAMMGWFEQLTAQGELAAVRMSEHAHNLLSGTGAFEHPLASVEWQCELKS